MKVLLTFGTRPEAIKMAPLVDQFRQSSFCETKVCITGQHRSMLDQVISFFDIPVDYDLDIMRAEQDLCDISMHVLQGMRDIFLAESFDLVLVHGDTTTSTMAALAAFYAQIPVGHVEAGLRTYNVSKPWPEEMNRQLTGRLATYHFAPTEQAQKNLLQEGVPQQHIWVTGNTVVDALLLAKNQIRSSDIFMDEIRSDLVREGILHASIDAWSCSSRKMVLITAHRRENMGTGIREIGQALVELAERYPDVDWVYPVHLNPQIKEPIEQCVATYLKGKDRSTCNIFLISPVAYPHFVFLMDQAHLILTDSGGVQEEAPSLGKPVLVMREETERPEALAAGTVQLVGAKATTIVTATSQLLSDQTCYEKMSQKSNPFGDGTAASQITHICQSIR